MAPPPRQADQGAPLGGIGCGSVGRSHAGAFNRFDLQPGRCRDNVAAACQFSLRVRRGTASPAACVLSTLPRDALVACGLVDAGSPWHGLDAARCAFRDIYPRAWYVYGAGALPAAFGAVRLL